jgi:ribosomal protein S18 acetylase RimI-like enzyme
MKEYTLRPATDADYDFLYQLIVVCMKEYVTATWGWDEEYQRQHFAAHFNPSHSQIIVVDGQDAGRFALIDGGDSFFLSTIYIMPAFQNQGLGTAIIQDVISKAKSAGRPVRLQVLKVNPARRLYERLGFQTVEETINYYVMFHYVDAHTQRRSDS